MKTLCLALGAALVASTAAAADGRGNLLGEPFSPAHAHRTITITSTTQYVNVSDRDVVTFVQDGKEFTWYFDGPPIVNSFLLNRVAPAGMLDHDVTAYILRNISQ